MSNATIIADASFCPETHGAGYAYWIASQRGKRGGQGAFNGPIESCTTAEAMALVNALWDAMRNGLVERGDSILLQTDCIGAINVLSARLISSQPGMKKAFAEFTKLVVNGGFAVKFKHVKGHTQNEAARYVVNRICDKNAKKHMQNARNSIRAKALKERFTRES